MNRLPRILLCILRMTAFALGMAVLTFIQYIIKACTGSIAFTQIWHKFACWVFGLRVTYHGTPAGLDKTGDGAGRPVIYMSNHLSYIDICVLGANVSAVFVSKSDVRDWPVFGPMSALQKTVYIRRVRSAMDAALADISDRVAAGYDIVVFPEGTSSSGAQVLPFKAGLFEMAYAPTNRGAIRIQPVAIVVEKIGGKAPVSDDIRNQYAWWRPEDTLMPHLLNLASIWRTEISVYYLPPLDAAGYASRKELAEATHKAIAEIVDDAARNGYTTPYVPVAQPDRATVS